MMREALLGLRLGISRHAPRERLVGQCDDLLERPETRDGPFSELIRESVRTARSSLLEGDDDAALRVVQFIHNLPSRFDELDLWDEAHFYQVELISFLESEPDLDRVKTFLHFLGRAPQPA